MRQWTAPSALRTYNAIKRCACARGRHTNQSSIPARRRAARVASWPCRVVVSCERAWTSARRATQQKRKRIFLSNLFPRPPALANANGWRAARMPPDHQRRAPKAGALQDEALGAVGSGEQTEGSLSRPITHYYYCFPHVHCSLLRLVCLLALLKLAASRPAVG